MTYLLAFLRLSFTDHTFLILTRSSLSIISFMDCVFGVLSQKASPHPGSSTLTHIIFWEFYSVVVCIQVSIHFEITFMKDVSLYPDSLSQLQTSTSSAHLLKCLLLHYITFALLSELSGLNAVLLLGSVSCSVDLCSVPSAYSPIPLPVWHCWGCCRCLVSLEVRSRLSSAFLLQYCAGMLGPVSLQVNLESVDQYRYLC